MESHQETDCKEGPTDGLTICRDVSIDLSVCKSLSYLALAD